MAVEFINMITVLLVFSETQKELKSISSWDYLYIITLCAVSLFAVYLLMKYNSNNKLIQRLFYNSNTIYQQKVMIEQMNLELEKRMLRAQINPHFIFNVLNSIQFFITSDNKESAVKYLNDFAVLLRKVLETSDEVNVLLSEEIKLLNLYIQLESLRFDNAFHYEFYVDSNLDVDQYEVPVFLIQPFIENAILHGLLPKIGNKFLSIRLEDSKNFIICIIEDNGIGIEAAEKEKLRRGRVQPSVGLSVTYQRLKLLEKDLEFKTSVDVTDVKDELDESKGTKVVIKIPKQ